MKVILFIILSFKLTFIQAQKSCHNLASSDLKRKNINCTAAISIYSDNQSCTNSTTCDLNRYYKSEYKTLRIPVKYYYSDQLQSVNPNIIDQHLDEVNSIFSSNFLNIGFYQAYDKHDAGLHMCNQSSDCINCDNTTSNFIIAEAGNNSNLIHVLIIDTYQEAKNLSNFVFDDPCVEISELDGCDYSIDNFLGGFATFPKNSGLPDNIVVIGNDEFSSPHILTHEFGHILGLFHTFECTEFGSIDNSCQGDGIFDTQADFSAELNFGNGNLMDYNPSNLSAYNLSKCQKAKMLDVLFECRGQFLGITPERPNLKLDKSGSETSLVNNGSTTIGISELDCYSLEASLFENDNRSNTGNYVRWDISGQPSIHNHSYLILSDFINSVGTYTFEVYDEIPYNHSKISPPFTYTITIVDDSPSLSVTTSNPIDGITGSTLYEDYYIGDIQFTNNSQYDFTGELMISLYTFDDLFIEDIGGDVVYDLPSGQSKTVNFYDQLDGYPFLIGDYIIKARYREITSQSPVIANSYNISVLPNLEIKYSDVLDDKPMYNGLISFNINDSYNSEVTVINNGINPFNATFYATLHKNNSLSCSSGCFNLNLENVTLQPAGGSYKLFNSSVSQSEGSYNHYVKYFKDGSMQYDFTNSNINGQSIIFEEAENPIEDGVSIDEMTLAGLNINEQTGELHIIMEAVAHSHNGYTPLGSSYPDYLLKLFKQALIVSDWKHYISLDICDPNGNCNGYARYTTPFQDTDLCRIFFEQDVDMKKYLFTDPTFLGNSNSNIYDLWYEWIDNAGIENYCQLPSFHVQAEFKPESVTFRNDGSRIYITNTNIYLRRQANRSDISINTSGLSPSEVSVVNNLLDNWHQVVLGNLNYGADQLELKINGNDPTYREIREYFQIISLAQWYKSYSIANKPFNEEINSNNLTGYATSIPFSQIYWDDQALQFLKIYSLNNSDHCFNSAVEAEGGVGFTNVNPISEGPITTLENTIDFYAVYNLDGTFQNGKHYFYGGKIAADIAQLNGNVLSISNSDIVCEYKNLNFEIQVLNSGNISSGFFDIRFRLQELINGTWFNAEIKHLTNISLASNSMQNLTLPISSSEISGGLNSGKYRCLIDLDNFNEVNELDESDNLISTYFDVLSDEAIVINSPQNNEVYKSCDIIFDAYLISCNNDDGIVAEDNSISWSSNLDGFLGTGDLTNYPLSPGQHVITATYNLSGNNYTQTTNVTIADLVYYRDFDGDGVGNSNIPLASCEQPAGYVVTSGDCNDSNPNYINADLLLFRDLDLDGYGNPNASILSCGPADGWVRNNLDCNDSNSSIFPGAEDVCDGIDNDCNSQTIEECCSYTAFIDPVDGGNMFFENVPNTEDDFDWILIENNTPSNYTGPLSASYGDQYLYTEATQNFNKRAEMISNCIDLATNQFADPMLTMRYHMNGEDMGTLEVQVSIDNKSSWISVFSRSGHQSEEWRTVEFDLTPFTDEIIYFKLIGITGDGYRSDMAIDFIYFYDNCYHFDLLTGPLQYGDRFYEDDQEIVSIQKLRENSNFIYDSKISVELLPGFEVELNTVFEAYIDGCDN